MEGLLPITVTTRSSDDAHIAVRTAAGHEFSLPSDLVPKTCGPGGCFSLDLDAVTDADMPEEMRHRMSRALLNELLAAGTA